MGIARRRPGALGLSTLIGLTLLALVAPTAQANWLVEGSELPENEPVAAGGHTTFAISVPGLNLEIQCSTASSSNLKLIGKSSIGEGDIELSSCKAFSPPGSGKESKLCNPQEPIVFGVKYLALEHGKHFYILLDPKKSGANLATIKFSEMCALTETSDITGTVVDECGHLVEPPGTWVFLGCEKTEKKHYLRPASPSLFPGDQVKFGSQSAQISGITELELSGVNEGKGWST